MQSVVKKVYRSSEMRSKKPHFHDCHQIILVLKGRVQFCINGINYSAKAGDVAVFSRYENHSIQVESETYERYVLHLDPEVINRKSAVYSLLTDRPVGFCNVIGVSSYFEEIVGVFERLVQEHGAICNFADEMEQLAVKQLLILLYRCTSCEFAPQPDDVVVAVKRQFENYCADSYTLQGLAKRYGISVSALSHRFHAVTGVSVMEYLQSCRIAQAKQLLAEADQSIGEIVEECGFSDSSNFSRTFKRINGISPSKFRQKYKAR